MQERMWRLWEGKRVTADGISKLPDSKQTLERGFERKTSQGKVESAKVVHTAAGLTGIDRLLNITPLAPTSVRLAQRQCVSGESLGDLALMVDGWA